MQKEKFALVTGAAGGIGVAVSRRFLKEGYSVILVDRNKETLASKFKMVSPPQRMIAVHADLGRKSGLQALRIALDQLNDTELSAAAFCHGSCVVDGNPFPTVEYWEESYRNNVISSINVMEVCAESLRRGQANLVILSSVDAILALEGAGPYDAAKAALLSLAKAISRAYAPDICAITLVLGTVATQAWRQAIAVNPGALRKRANENLAGKVIEPDEVAGLVWLLCQKEARIMRGQSVVADNGWSFLAGTFQFDRRKGPSRNLQGWSKANPRSDS